LEPDRLSLSAYNFDTVSVGRGRFGEEDVQSMMNSFKSAVCYFFVSNSFNFAPAVGLFARISFQPSS
jgi:hypothetical protein